MITLQLLDSPDGNLLADWSNGVNITPRTNDHGFASLTCFIPMSLADSFRFYDASQGKHLSLNYGAGVVWEGRVEDPKIVDGGLQITALGYWRAFSDVPYTALWSVSETADWRALNSNDLPGAAPALFEMDNNNRLYIAPRKNEVFNSATDGILAYHLPHGGSRRAVGIQFDFQYNGDANYRFYLITRDSSYGYVDAPWSANGSGSAVSGSVNITLTACDIVTFGVDRSTGGATYTGETGATYLKITNVRIVTSNTNRIAGSTATTISAGSNVVTPASMTGIYVGQRLCIASANNPSESVTVTAVTSTTFTATFVNAYSGATSVRAHLIYADQIISDLVAHVTAVNPTQLSTSTALIESPGLDLLDESYEDAWPADIATKLAGLGDDQDPPRRWEVGVWEGQRLHFRPRGSAGQSWSVDSERLVVDGTLAQLFNSAYGVYQDENGRTLRTAVSDDDASQARYSLVRRAAVATRTTSSTQAGVHRDAFLADRGDLTPRGDVEVDLLMDAAGAIYPKWMARSGDTFTLRNLPPVLSESIDKIRTFLLAETAYDADNDVIKPVPESPIPSLELLVARRAEGF